MKNILALATIAGLTGSAFAQLSPLPPTSTLTLGAFNFASNGTETDPNPTALGWTVNPPPSIMSHIGSITADGGTIRAIFTGESAGWLNDFGYTYGGNPADATSRTVFSDIQAVSPSNIDFGDYFDVKFDNLNKSTAATFDFWLNGVGAEGAANGPGLAQGHGGVYTAIHPTNSTPYILGQVRWAPRPLFVNTWVQALNSGLGGYTDVATYLVGFEDVRSGVSYRDGDTNDFMFALQFFRDDGTPFTPVPEPSTYGLIGALALVGLIVRRRFQAKKA
jgi:PEP-CTERM motif